MNKLILTSLLLISNLSLLSQVSAVWSVRYNGPGDNFDEATSIAIDNSGNVYVTGASDGVGSGTDWYTVKYSSGGAVIWSQRFNGPGNGDDDAYGIRLDNSGNVYVYGVVTGSGLDMCVIKYNSSGVQQWVNYYNGPGNATDEVYDLAIDNNSNVYVTGYSNGGSTMDDICLLKYNSSGVQQWVMRYNGPIDNDDYGNSIVLDNANNIIITGAVTTNNDLDYLTIKYNPSGTILWQQTYNGPANDIDFPSSNGIDNSGNIYVTGYSGGIGSGLDYCTIKYNSVGTALWTMRYNGTANGIDEAYSIVVDGSGNSYVTGNSAGTGTMDDYCTIKYDATGNQSWVARYDGSTNDDYANSIRLDNAGNVYVTGQSWFNGQEFNYSTIRYNPANGAPMWTISYNGPINRTDEAVYINVDATGNVYVTGGSFGNGNEMDYYTVKYVQTIGIHQISNEVPKSFSLSQNYPNPFNPVTKIKIDIPQIQTRNVKLVIYNTLGKEIETLVNEQLNAGTYEADWDASNYPSGVYYYTLISENFKETRKMILVK